MTCPEHWENTLTDCCWEFTGCGLCEHDQDAQ